jgi:hypothetical protein
MNLLELFDHIFMTFPRTGGFRLRLQPVQEDLLLRVSRYPPNVCPRC